MFGGMDSRLVGSRKPNLPLHTDAFHSPARQNYEVSQRRRPVKLACELGRWAS